MVCVLDASMAAAWALPDESHAGADLLLTRMAEVGATVPALWWFEIRNILLVAERRGRIAPGDAEIFLGHLQKLKIEIAELGDGAAVMRLARAHRLSVYDASYLELALRKNLPLSTLDRALIEAAKRECLPEMGS